MRKFLFAAVAIGALCGLAGTHEASAAPVQPGVHATQGAPIVEADWRWRHEHYHHRRWHHHRWYYYN
jgi:hypothetical protein